MEPRDSEGLIPIGRFARLSGLSIGALRHYDELDLLRPADVDPFTGYRRYRAEQLEVARTIGRLRDLEVPSTRSAKSSGRTTPATVAGGSAFTSAASRPGSTGSSASSTSPASSARERSRS